MKRSTLVVALVAVIVGIALAGTALSRFVAGSRALALDGSAVQAAIPEPNVPLVDQDGKPFRLTNERGKELVLFFGYAHCPDVCPTTLAKLAQADRMLGSDAKDVAVAFVTVDPDRDTAPALKRYVDLFNPRFYGVTGPQPSLDALYDAYHVWHEKLPSHGSAAGYLMAHSSAIYMLDRNGNLRVIHDWTDSPTVLAHDMRALLS